MEERGHRGLLQLPAVPAAGWPHAAGRSLPACHCWNRPAGWPVRCAEGHTPLLAPGWIPQIFMHRLHCPFFPNPNCTDPNPIPNPSWTLTPIRPHNAIIKVIAPCLNEPLPILAAEHVTWALYRLPARMEGLAGAAGATCPFCPPVRPLARNKGGHPLTAPPSG